MKKKNYYWAKGYKYTRVPVWSWYKNVFGWFTISIQSTKTKCRRTGIKLTVPELYDKYRELLAPPHKVNKVCSQRKRK